MTEAIFPEMAKSIDYWDLVTYISQCGWKRVDTESNLFVVFKDPVNAETDSVEIVIPKNENARELPLYISNAIDILGATGSTPVFLISDNIKSINRDIFRLHINPLGNQETIPLRAAAQKVNDLKQMVAFGACSEFDRKPYYVNSQMPDAKTVIEDFRFGHTFRGSFGFTVESPRLKEIHTYQQLDLFPGANKEQSIYRRVMERIARGLIYADRAQKDKDSKWLLETYEKGLNANMCRSLADIIGESGAPVSFEIRWAPIEKPDDSELLAFKSVALGESARDHLRLAAKQLVETYQEEVTIQGRVVELNAEDSPLDLNTDRNVRIRWYDPATATSYEATATLELDDYQRAVDAHKNWLPVEITGVLMNRKNVWRFVSYKSFVVKPVIPDQP